MKVKNFFSEVEKKNIIQAIADAELNTSGEIRLHVENKCDGNPSEKAIEVFHKLNMHKTELRNGVLFYLAIDARKFAVIGDKGINDLVPVNFWDDVKNGVFEHFKKNEFAKGICAGIELTGEKLKAHFPYQADDTNELSNEISFGDASKN